jgi:hypothetical protein
MTLTQAQVDHLLAIMDLKIDCAKRPFDWRFLEAEIDKHVAALLELPR